MIDQCHSLLSPKKKKNSYICLDKKGGIAGYKWISSRKQTYELLYMPG